MVVAAFVLSNLRHFSKLPNSTLTNFILLQLFSDLKVEVIFIYNCCFSNNTNNVHTFLNMQAPTTIVKSTTSKLDVLHELRSFIAGSTKCSKSSSPLELVKTSLCLLKTLPASRFAVLDYLRNVFETASSNYIKRIETEISTGKLPPPNEYDESILSEVYTVLSGFVSNNAEAWAPVISAWSLELLGEISSKFAGRAHICSGLNETLQLWMNCRATRTLIDITTQCLSCLMHSDTEACISALLDTSVKHSPNFDWVVAHVGSCFPQTVIVRVLSCGLKDFYQNKSYQQGRDSPKIKSVVGILGHLATSHTGDIKKAILDLFKWSLLETSFQEGDVVRLQKKATVPFLLHLITLSNTLLNAVSDEVQNILPINVILQLYEMVDDWCKYFGSSDELEQVIGKLILNFEKGGVQVINILLNCVFLNNENDKKLNTISTNARILLEFLLQELDYSIRFKNNKRVKIVRLLNALIYDSDEINKMFLCSENLKIETAARITIYIGQRYPEFLIKIVSFILLNATENDHLALLVRILSNELIDRSASPYNEKGGHFAVVLENILNSNRNQADSLQTVQFWKNLLTLLRWESLDKIFILQSHSISKGVEYNLLEITTMFKDGLLNIESQHVLTTIMDLLKLPVTYNSYNIPVHVLVNCVHGTVNYFFNCCNETDEVERICGFKRAKNILKRISCFSKIARNLALRLLLEKSLFGKESEFFGAILSENGDNNDSYKLLLTQNKKISKTIHLTKHSSVYNGGIIGKGKRKSISCQSPPADLVTSNTEELLTIIKSCCSLNDQNDRTEVFLDSITLVSLMLVQLVSPDVMYNGLPWPEEEFSKVTIERDLLIRRLFNNIPLIWDLLELVALYRPALCYCSVLIRALTATLMHQWTSTGDQSKSIDTGSYKALMNTSIRVIDVMALGQLVPPPLSNVRDVLPYLTSHEIVAILRECIWFYLRDHIPSPALFTIDSNGIYWRDPSVVRPPDIYTKMLKIIMQRNVKIVGHLYSQMFIVVPKCE